MWNSETHSWCFPRSSNFKAILSICLYYPYCINIVNWKVTVSQSATVLINLGIKIDWTLETGIKYFLLRKLISMRMELRFIYKLKKKLFSSTESAKNILKQFSCVLIIRWKKSISTLISCIVHALTDLMP